MSSFQNKHSAMALNFNPERILPHKISRFNLLMLYICALVFASAFDLIYITTASTSFLALYSNIAYLLLVLCPKRLWHICIWPILLIPLLVHSVTQPINQSLIFESVIHAIAIAISALITQRILFNALIFTVSFIHRLLSCVFIFAVIYQFSIAVLVNDLPALASVNYGTLVEQMIGQTAGFIITINTLFMVYMARYHAVYNTPKLTNNRLLILLTVAASVYLTLHFGGDLIHFLSLFGIIPGLWCSYQYRWWGLSCFAVVINMIAVIYISITMLTLPYYDALQLSLLLGFSLDDVSWFLLVFNVVVIYINAMMFELDKTQNAIEMSQSAMVTRNDEIETLNHQIDRLNSHLLTVQETQRNKLSSELQNHMEQHIHELQQAINLLELKASYTHAQDNPFTKIKSYTHYITLSVFELIHWLKPEILGRLGFVGTIQSKYFAEKLALSHIQYRWVCHTEIEKIPENIALMLFRVTQEAVNNTIKHSKATELTIELAMQGSMLEYTMTDNGVGFTRPLTKTGFGLSGMENRVRTLKGDFTLTSSNGTKIKIVIPIT